MNDLEARLRHQLREQATSLPEPVDRADHVIQLGRRRRTRNRVAGSAAGFGLAILTFFAIDAVAPFDRPATVVANEPANGEPDPNAPRPSSSAPQTDDTPTSDVPTSVPSTASSTLTVPPTSPVDDAPVEVAPSDPAAVPDSALLFRADHEGCAELPDPRAHPQWIEGQFNDARNGDGTPTHGFAYNTGDATADQIDWRFATHPSAPSGRCVAALSLGRADDPVASDAVRLFRRYDHNGQVLPADAFYSAWILIPEEVAFDRRATVDGQTVFGFWTIMSIQNRMPVTEADRGAQPEATISESTFSIGAGRRTDRETMSLTVYSRSRCGSDNDCPEAQSLVPIRELALPAGRWVHLEVGLASRQDGTGRLQVWQDGNLLFDYSGQTDPTNLVAQQLRSAP